jgi:hypothetical protein
MMGALPPRRSSAQADRLPGVRFGAPVTSKLTFGVAQMKRVKLVVGLLSFLDDALRPLEFLGVSHRREAALYLHGIIDHKGKTARFSTALACARLARPIQGGSTG